MLAGQQVCGGRFLHQQLPAEKSKHAGRSLPPQLLQSVASWSHFWRLEC